MTTPEGYEGHWWGEKPAIRAVVSIRRNADGVVRSYEDDFYGDSIWEEGNYACDCNREIFFAAVVGEDDSDGECGHEAYSLRIVAKDDGRLLYEDDAWADAQIEAP